MASSGHLTRIPRLVRNALAGVHLALVALTFGLISTKMVAAMSGKIARGTLLVMWCTPRSSAHTCPGVKNARYASAMIIAMTKIVSTNLIMPFVAFLSVLLIRLQHRRSIEVPADRDASRLAA